MGGISPRETTANRRAAYNCLRPEVANQLTPMRPQGRSQGPPGGRCGVISTLLGSHHSEPGSIPGGVASGLSHMGIVPDDAARCHAWKGVQRREKGNDCIRKVRYHLSHFIRACLPHRHLFVLCTESGNVRIKELELSFAWHGHGKQICGEWGNPQGVFKRLPFTVLSSFLVRGRGGVVVRLLTSDLGEWNSPPGGVAFRWAQRLVDSEVIRDGASCTERTDWGRNGKESTMSFVRDPFQHSPGVISENHEKLKLGWPGREWNPGHPQCESSEFPLSLTGFSHVGIVPDDAAGWRVFSGICHFPRPCIPVLHTHLTSPSSGLKTSTLRAVQISPTTSFLVQTATSKKFTC
ncbi:hypothetical protein PR048_007904 [Dryococelus australis]|uniref:Uncharacterized protein n=1 Tax=Dryococelus australis TaxID=614101 RepID=A0ABQ9HWF7_9NEOP|nr:hypothetical protein PR048_007904 [Dryococelus australis]